MSATNLVSASLTLEQRQAVLANLAAIKTSLPFLAGLSPEERGSVTKMGNKSLAFVEQAVRAAEAHPNAMPPAFNVPEFRSDLELWQALQPIALEVTRLNELLDDTLLALGSDLYTGGLATYTYLKAAGSTDGLDELKSQLSRRFARRSATATAQPTPATAA